MKYEVGGWSCGFRDQIPGDRKGRSKTYQTGILLATLNITRAFHQVLLNFSIHEELIAILDFELENSGAILTFKQSNSPASMRCRESACNLKWQIKWTYCASLYSKFHLRKWGCGGATPTQGACPLPPLYLTQVRTAIDLGLRGDFAPSQGLSLGIRSFFSVSSVYQSGVIGNAVRNITGTAIPQMCHHRSSKS